nr:MAG TPA: chitin synthase regulator [Bacteriophage sp.]
MKLIIFFIIVGVLLFLYLFIFSVCCVASKESRYEEMRQKELHNKSEPTDENS